MKNRVLIEESFKKPARRLAKRYPSFPNDVLQLIGELETNALLGASLGRNLRKIRLAIRSKGKGKSGGARVIAYTYLKAGRIHLLTVYDKSDRENISDEELTRFLAELEAEHENEI